MTATKTVEAPVSFAGAFEFNDEVVTLDPSKQYKITPNGTIWEIIENGFKLIAAGDPNYVKPALQPVPCYAGIGLGW